MARMTEEFARMEVGDTIVYPIERLCTVQSTASRQGLVLNRKYRTAPNKEMRIITVTRVE